MQVELKGDTLHIAIPVNKVPEISASGKSKVVASTHGNLKTNVMVEGKPLTIGLNAYIPTR